MATAEALVRLAEWWLWVGAASAVPFVAFLGRLAPAARGAWVFRPLLIPGMLLLWPLVWWRVLRGPGPWTARHAPPLRAQGALGLAMVGAVLGALALGAAIRQGPPPDPAAVQIEPAR